VPGRRVVPGESHFNYSRSSLLPVSEFSGRRCGETVDCRTSPHASVAGNFGGSVQPSERAPAPVPTRAHVANLAPPASRGAGEAGGEWPGANHPTFPHALSGHSRHPARAISDSIRQRILHIEDEPGCEIRGGTVHLPGPWPDDAGPVPKYGRRVRSRPREVGADSSGSPHRSMIELQHDEAA
jgi:hypothetical protein